jgi:effector-binding domain-containing protein
MLKKTLGALVVLVVLFFAVGLALPRKVHLERSTSIAAPQATVFTLVNGYKRYNQWSPWAAKDPSATYTFEGPAAGPGARMSWQGDAKTVGTGAQWITESTPFEKVVMNLDFGADGAATSSFLLAPEADGTRLTWTFETDLGRNPVSRYVGMMMEGMLAPDFEQGLASLKTLAEGLPKADFATLMVETVEVRPATLAYVEASTPKDDQAMAKAMGQAYEQVMKFVATQKLTTTAPPVSVNTKADDTGYTFQAGVPVDRLPEKPIPTDSPVQIRQSYAGKALKVVHKGAYRDMSKTYDQLLAYTAANGLEQAGFPWDEYVNDPQKVPEAELVTQIYLPIK